MSIELKKSPELAQVVLGAVEFENVHVLPATDALRLWSNEVARSATQAAEQAESEAAS